MPMLHIGGLTSTNRTYTAAVAILLRETTNWYTIALEAFVQLTGAASLPIKVVITDREPALHHAIDTHLPNTYRLLCLWHLGENVKKDALADFRNAWLSLVVAAKTGTAVDEGMDALRNQFIGERFEPALDYVEGLLDMKERFIHAYTDQYTHLNQWTISCLEGTQRALKDVLSCHHGDLYLVNDALQVYFSQQWTNVCAEIAFPRHRTPVEARLFKKVRSHPSPAAAA